MDTQKIIYAIQDLAKGNPTDQNISDLLYRHRCLYLLSQTTDPTYKNKTLSQQALNKIAIKERYNACKELFEQISFPYAVIKGAVLSQSIYDSPFYRESGDIDIIVSRENIDVLKKALKSLGFIQGRVTDNGIVPFNRNELIFQTTATHQIAPFIKQTSNPLCPFINLDVNMDIMWGESDTKSDMNYVLSYTEQAMMFDVPFTRLSSEMEFISLCLHHYKDMNSIYLLSSRGLRLEHFCDIYFYLKNVRPNAQKILEICKHLKVGKYVCVCLCHTNQIFEDPLLLNYIEALSSEEDPILFDTFGLNEKELKKWEFPLPERLFHPDLPQYLNSILSEYEKEKVRLNRMYM